MSRKSSSRAVSLVALVAGLAVLAAPGHGVCHADAATSASTETSICTEQVFYGELLVVDSALRSFVLLGLDKKFVAPATIDVVSFDGVLVRVDLDGRCNVRTVVRAARLEGPMVEV